MPVFVIKIIKCRFHGGDARTIDGKLGACPAILEPGDSTSPPGYSTELRQPGSNVLADWSSDTVAFALVSHRPLTRVGSVSHRCLRQSARLPVQIQFFVQGSRHTRNTGV
jgi:hypothetical protein